MNSPCIPLYQVLQPHTSKFSHSSLYIVLWVTEIFSQTVYPLGPPLAPTKILALIENWGLGVNCLHHHQFLISSDLFLICFETRGGLHGCKVLLIATLGYCGQIKTQLTLEIFRKMRLGPLLAILLLIHIVLQFTFFCW